MTAWRSALVPVSTMPNVTWVPSWTVTNSSTKFPVAVRAR